MRVLFDACTSPRLAAALDRHLSTAGGRAFHVADLPGGLHAPDRAWIAQLRGWGGAGLVVTGNLRLFRVPALRLALRDAGLRGLVLASGVQALGVDRQASLLVERWPEVEERILGAPSPILLELPAGRSGDLRPL